MLTKIDIYRAVICLIPLFGSECWELKRSEFSSIEKLNKRILNRITFGEDFKESIQRANLLPPLYYKVLKDLFVFQSIVSGKYTVDFTKRLTIQWSGRRTWIRLTEIRYEAQRQNFWYRTGFRINIIQQRTNFFELQNPKSVLINTMWDYFNRNWTDSNPCLWIFLCLCETFRANSML